jgi:outer membrane immunogenic protein
VTRHLLATVAFAALLAGSAAAADLSVRQQPYRPMPIINSWSGLYVGGNVGGAWLNSSESFINNVGFVDPLTYRSSSLIGGGHAGAQGQWGNWVLGVEGTYSVASLTETVPSINPGFPRTRSLRADDIVTFTGKVGYTGGPWMIYAKAGWAALRIVHSSFNPLNALSSVSSEDWHNGWTVGAGLDYMFLRNWIASVEFNYYNASYDGAQQFTNGAIGSVINSHAEVYAVTGRLSYLFNWGGPVVARY